MLAQVAGVIERIGLQVRGGEGDFRQGSLGKDIVRDVLDRALGDLVDEADIGVLTRRDPRNDLTPGHFGVDDRLPATAAIVDHHNKILHCPIGSIRLTIA